MVKIYTKEEDTLHNGHLTACMQLAIAHPNARLRLALQIPPRTLYAIEWEGLLWIKETG